MQVHLYSGQTLGLFWWIVYCIGELDRNSVILKQKFFLKKTRLIGKTKRQNKKICSLLINIPIAMQADLKSNKKLTTADRNEQ